MQAKELAVILSVSKSKAGQIIRELNKELEDEGYIAIRGRIPVQLARKKFPYHDLSDQRIMEELKKKMSKTYKSYLVAVLCFTVLAIVLMPFLYFTTAWSIADSQVLQLSYSIKNTFMNNKNCYLRQQVTVSST